MVLYISNIKLSHSCPGQVNHFLRTSAENLSTDKRTDSRSRSTLLEILTNGWHARKGRGACSHPIHQHPSLTPREATRQVNNHYKKPVLHRSTTLLRLVLARFGQHCNELARHFCAERRREREWRRYLEGDRFVELELERRGLRRCLLHLLLRHADKAGGDSGYSKSGGGSDAAGYYKPFAKRA
jgi:hypothetical protein